MGYAHTKILYTANRTNPRATTNPVYLPVIPFNTPAPSGSLLFGRDGKLLLGLYAELRIKPNENCPKVRVWSSDSSAHFDVRIAFGGSSPLLSLQHRLAYYAEASPGGDQRAECEFISLYGEAGWTLPYLIRPKLSERAGDETWWLDYGAFYYKSNITGVAGQSPIGTYDFHSAYEPDSGAIGYDTHFAQASWGGGLDPAKNEWTNYETEESISPFPQVEIEAYAWPVLYGANGATSGGVPDAQTKFIGTTLVLATNTRSLAKTGKTFSGWNTKMDGSGVDYAVGANYTTDNFLILYAKWT